MSYEVEIAGGDRDPPPRYTYDGLGGVSNAMRAILLRALTEQRVDGQQRQIIITLPNVRALPEQDRRARRLWKKVARKLPGSSPEDVKGSGAAPTRRRIETPRW